jgi:hypothetical protein
MPRLCSIDIHKDTATISKEVANGIPFSEISLRYNVDKSSVHRHAQKCLKIFRRGKNTNKGPRTGAARVPPSKRPLSSRIASDDSLRCTACGQLVGESVDPKSLIRRSERLLFSAEQVVQRAEASDDSRLCLLGIDRAEKVLTQLMKALHMVGPDVLVDKRSQSVNFYGEVLKDFSEQDLRILKSRLVRTIEAEQSGLDVPGFLGHCVATEGPEGNAPLNTAVAA